MTNEETLSALILMRDNCLSKHEYDDPMRVIKHRALTVAIKAIENQERMKRELKSLDGIADTCDKLEKALELEAQNINCEYCFVKCSGIPDDNCNKRIAMYFKRKAGIEVENNDND